MSCRHVPSRATAGSAWLRVLEESPALDSALGFHGWFAVHRRGCCSCSKSCGSTHMPSSRHSIASLSHRRICALERSSEYRMPAARRALRVTAASAYKTCSSRCSCASLCAAVGIGW
jgi:hypothetical protein